MSLARALFNLQHSNSFNLDASEYRTVFNHWLFNPSPGGLPVARTSDFSPVAVDSSWSWSFQKDHDQDTFYNTMESDSITVATCVVIGNQMPQVSI